MTGKYEALATLLERFDWLHDSQILAIALDGNRRYDIRATLFINAMDSQDGFAPKTLKLVLTDVAEFSLSQMPRFAAFETSQGAAITEDGGQLLLDMGGPPGFTEEDGLPVDFVWSEQPRHLAPEEVRKRGFYLCFKDFTSEILPPSILADDIFGIPGG